MKKSVLLLAGFALASVSMSAQTKPTVNYANFAEAVSAEEPANYYLYNVESGLFLTGGNYWGTRACAVNNGSNSSSNNATITDLYYNKASVNGYKWQITASGETTSETGDPCYSFANKTTKNYLTADGWDGIWVDGDATRPYNFWYVKDLGSNTFEMYYESGNENIDLFPFGIPERAYDVEGNTNTFFVSANATYEATVDGETVIKQIFDGPKNTTWALVTEEEYERVKPLIVLYFKAQGLAVELRDAKNAYPDVDFSGPEAVLKNSDTATEEDLSAASQAIKDAIAAYESSKATFDEPMKMDIGDNAGFSPWKQEFTGEGTLGDTAWNTWSTEADGGADGTDMVKPFAQVWKAAGTNLSSQKVYQKINATPGLYKLTINARAYSEAGGIDKFEGLSMYFGETSVDLQDETEMFKSGNKCVLWKKGGFTIIAIVKESCELEFGFNIEDPNWNWIAWKNAELTFYGNKDVEENKAKLEAALLTKYEKATEVDANPELIAAYNELVDQVNAATDIDTYKELAKQADEAKKALDDNAEAYAELVKALKGYDKTIGEKTDLAGAEWDDFCDFMQSEEELGIEGYPTPAAPVILNGDRSLSTEEVNSYLSTLNKLFADAVAKSVSEGSDCSDMIVNAKFTDPKGGGWTVSGSATLYGGLYNFPTAENYCGIFDVYQIVEGVPDGIYSLSLNGFCRLENNDYPEVSAEIYMNDFATTLSNIKTVKHMVAEEEAVDGFNCYLTSAEDGPWTTNPIFQVDDEGTPCKHWSPYNSIDSNIEIEGVKYYYPNGMEGASVAFSAGRYQAKVYGLVKGGKMRIGIRNQKAKNQWALWSNFTLIYEGKSEAALQEVLPIYQEQLSEFYTENAENMTTATSQACEKALKAADNAQDADAMFDALEEINSALSDAKENVKAVQSLIGDGEDIVGAYPSVCAAIEEYPAASEEVLGTYNKWTEKAESYMDLTTEEINTLVAESTALIGQMRTSNALSEVDLTAASAEAPVDVTAAIVNNSFEDGLNGWTVVTGGDTGAKENSNATYTINWPTDEETGETLVEAGDYVFNTWSSSIPTDGLPASQVIYGLPAGTYTLTAYFATDVNNKCTLSANGNSETITIEGDKTTPQLAELTFDYDSKEGPLTIKMVGSSWYKADVFTLAYLGAPDPTAIENVTAAKDAAATVAIYNAAGVRISKLQKGINIVKMANGKAKKVLVK